jgi:ABC-type transport system involved in multi-copper enzyme maturation permease subunit
MMSIIRWELSRRRWFMLWWSVGVSALVALTVLAYLSFKGNVAAYNRDFSGITSSAGAFFGGSDFFSPVGYLSSQIYYILLPILLIIMAVVLVSSLLGKDESDLTVELTLARPVSRLRLLGSKAIVALLVFVVVGCVSFAVMMACIKVAGLDITWRYVLLTHTLCFAFAGMFGAISFGLMAMSRLTRPIANACAIVLSFGGYVISSMGSYVGGFKHLAKLFPYHYYNTTELLSGKVSTGLLLYLAATGIVCAVLAAWGYRRRDIG